MKSSNQIRVQQCAAMHDRADSPPSKSTLMKMVMLSGEAHPLRLDKADRRYKVIPARRSNWRAALTQGPLAWRLRRQQVELCNKFQDWLCAKVFVIEQPGADR
jgi:hypothetical protein